MKNNSPNTEFIIFDILGKEISKGFIKGGTEKNITLTSKGIFILRVLDIKTKQIIHTQKIIVQ